MGSNLPVLQISTLYHTFQLGMVWDLMFPRDKSILGLKNS